MDVNELRARLRVYGITPDSMVDEAELRREIGAAAKSGMTAVQYRHKSPRNPEEHERMARAVVEVAREYGLLSIINDDPELAACVGADGVHLGADDRDISIVRRRYGVELIIGASPPSIASARAAVESGADYLGVGAIFDARGSKADASAARGVGWLAEMRAVPQLATVPMVAIGGIDVTNCRSCIAHGADGVASIRAIFGGGSARVSTERLVNALNAV